jgi:Na+-driven multidrug efflux pump
MGCRVIAAAVDIIVVAVVVVALLVVVYRWFQALIKGDGERRGPVVTSVIHRVGMRLPKVMLGRTI